MHNFKSIFKRLLSTKNRVDRNKKTNNLTRIAVKSIHSSLCSESKIMIFTTSHAKLN